MTTARKKYDGCPDSDEDGVSDQKDQCPEVWGPESNDGCPWPDKDDDGTPDIEDECPEVYGPPEYNGCPPSTPPPD